jgi:hypothetical protein
MWILEFKNKHYTCPEGNLYALALIQAMDRGITHGPIHDDLSAKAYLESIGFNIVEG